MPVQDEVYTIVDEDILRSRGGRRVNPDWRPSASVRGPASGNGSGPAIASSLSLFIPGAGQAWNGQRQLGLLLFVIQALAASAHWAIGQRWEGIVEMAQLFGWSEWQLFRALALADVAIVGLLLGGIYHAWRRAEHDAGGYDATAQPVVSGLASVVVPGWGQLLNGQPGKALCFLSGLLGGLYVVGFTLMTPVVRLMEEADPTHLLLTRATTIAMGVLGAGVLLWILSVYDAVLVSVYRRRMS
jgi:TM2 domain-containing membrane protein YozV